MAIRPQMLRIAASSLSVLMCCRPLRWRYIRDTRRPKRLAMQNFAVLAADRGPKTSRNSALPSWAIGTGCWWPSPRCRTARYHCRRSPPDDHPSSTSAGERRQLTRANLGERWGAMNLTAPLIMVLFWSGRVAWWKSAYRKQFFSLRARVTSDVPLPTPRHSAPLLP